MVINWSKITNILAKDLLRGPSNRKVCLICNGCIDFYAPNFCRTCNEKYQKKLFKIHAAAGKQAEMLSQLRRSKIEERIGGLT